MLDKELKKLKGSILSIGLDEKQLLILEENPKVTECYSLNSKNKVKSKGSSKGYAKTINIKKIKRIFKKKRFDYIICNFEQLQPYLRSFIKNSIYLNRKIMYFYNIKDFDLEELEKRYIRYNSKVKMKKDLIIIDNSKSKTNIFKNIGYYFHDLLYDTIEYISKILVN